MDTVDRDSPGNIDSGQPDGSEDSSGIATVIRALEENSKGRASITVTRDEDGLHVLAVPSNTAASRIILSFVDERNPRGLVLQAGAESHVCLDTDLRGTDWTGWRSFLDAAIRAIVAGCFTETIRYRAGLPIVVEMSLDLDGRRFEFTRTNVQNWFRSLGGEKASRTIQYAPYS